MLKTAILWKDVRAAYLARFKDFIAGMNRHLHVTRNDNMAAVYARLVRAVEQPAPLELADLIVDCEEALSYDVEKIETLDDGHVKVWLKSETKLFLVWFGTGIRSCRRVFGDADFVRYVRRFNLADCYRPQRDDEPKDEYDSAWFYAWMRFVELADSYGEHYIAGKILNWLDEETE